MIHLNTYEELLQDADDEQVHVHESVDLNGDSTGEKRLNGLYVDGHIALDSQLKTTAEKTSILAEEMGHHFTSVGAMDGRCQIDIASVVSAHIVFYILHQGLTISLLASCHSSVHEAVFFGIQVGSGRIEIGLAVGGYTTTSSEYHGKAGALSF